MDKTVFGDKIPSRILFTKYSSQSEVLRSGTSMAVQWLRLCAPIAGGVGLTPGQGTKILHATWYSQKFKR